MSRAMRAACLVLAQDLHHVGDDAAGVSADLVPGQAVEVRLHLGHEPLRLLPRKQGDHSERPMTGTVQECRYMIVPQNPCDDFVAGTSAPGMCASRPRSRGYSGPAPSRPCATAPAQAVTDVSSDGAGHTRASALYLTMCASRARTSGCCTLHMDAHMWQGLRTSIHQAQC